MFQVADPRFPPEQQTQAQTLPKSQSSVSQLHQHTSTVVITQGMTTMDPPPSIVHIDQNLLEELLKRFPEVPENVVINIIQRNHNQREECMMALVRESPRYDPANIPHNKSTSSLMLQGSFDSQSNVSNGLRNRSDSGGSRGSISGATGQSPTSQQHYQYYHSTSDPILANMTEAVPHQSPSTAPVHSEPFMPFPNAGLHRPSVEYQEGIPVSGNYPYGWGTTPVTSNVHEPWRPGQPGSIHPAPYPGQQTRYTPPSVPSRPGQFEKSFPPPTWDTTFSPGSPSAKPPSHGGTPTHLQTTQSPVTTPPRHPHPWETHNPTTSPTMYRPPPSSGQGGHGYPPSRSGQEQSGSAGTRAEVGGSKFISTISKFIGLNNEAQRNPSSINIDLGPTQNNHFNMASVNRDLPPPIPRRPEHTFRHSGARSMSVMDNQVVKNQPSKVLSHPNMTSLGTIPQSHVLAITSPGSSVGSGDFHSIPSSQCQGHQQMAVVNSSSREDTAYTQSLLVHQKARLEKLKQDMRSLLDHRDHLKQQVANKEQRVLQAQRNRVGNRPSISSHDVQKVREENRTLQVDCHLRTLEFDRITKGQAVIGRLNDDEDFYARIPAGQGVTSVSSSSGTGSTNTSSTSSSHVSTHPPAPPSAFPNRELSRDLDNLHETPEEPWSCGACTFDNHPELTLCEMCNMPRVGRR